MLGLLADTGEMLIPPGSRLEAWRRAHGGVKMRDWEDYFPSVAKQVANRLERRGVVRIEENNGELVVKITEKGRKEILKYKWTDFKPKSGKWDGLWRLVFFDVPEKEKRKRDELRGFLKMLGMRQMQESVFVYPYDIGGEIKYLREILGVPHAVKLAVLSWIENEDELKEIFELK